MNNVKILVLVKDFFPNEQVDKKSFINLIKRLSLTECLFFCSRILIVLFQNDFSDKKKNGFSSWTEPYTQLKILQFLNISISEEVEKNFKNNLYSDILNGNRKMFFHGQVLELIRWLILYGSDKTNDGETFNIDDVRTDFFKALLYASEFWSLSANKVLAKLSAQKTNITDNTKIQSLLMCRLNNFASEHFPGIKPEFALERGSYFFGELQKNLYKELPYKNFEKTFSDSTGLSISEYEDSLFLLGYTQFVLSPPDSILSPENKFIFDIKNFLSTVPNYNKKFQSNFERYINLESQTITDIKNHATDIYDFILSLRRKPLFKTTDGRFSILSPVFFIERATVGPLFIVLNQDCQNTENIFSNFGKIFEKYVQEIFERTIPKSAMLANILHAPYRYRNTEIDAVLDYGDKIIIIETKSSWVKDDVMYTSTSEEDYLNELRKKYCVRQCKGKSHYGGIYQLAGDIYGLINKKWGDEFCRANVIYPIMIIHNRFDASLLHSYFFNIEFISRLTQLLKKSNDKYIIEYNGYIIKSLIVITVDDLEAIESTIKSTQSPKPFIDIMLEYDKYSPDRNETLHNFLALRQYATENFFLRTKVKERLDYFYHLIK